MSTSADAESSDGVLNNDLLSYILDFLPLTVPMTLKCERVSKQFYTIADSRWPKVWHHTYSSTLQKNHRFAAIQMYLHNKQRSSDGSYIKVPVVLIGDGGVGKSALALRFTHSEFFPRYDPTIEDVYDKILEINGEQVKIHICDTACQDPHRLLYAHDGNRLAEAAIITCSLHDEFTVDAMEQYLLGLARLQEKEANKIPAVISVNKCDLDPNDRKSSMADVKEFAEKYGIKDIYETSAKENTNVTEVFTRVLELILTNVVLDPELIGKLENGESILKQNAKKKAKKKKCIVM